MPALQMHNGEDQQQQWGLPMPALQPMDLPSNNFVGAGIPAFELPQQQFHFYAEPEAPKYTNDMQPTVALFAPDVAAAQADQHEEDQACDMGGPLAADTATAEAEVKKTRDAKLGKKSKKGGLFCCGGH